MKSKTIFLFIVLPIIFANCHKEAEHISNSSDIEISEFLNETSQIQYSSEQIDSVVNFLVEEDNYSLKKFTHNKFALIYNEDEPIPIKSILSNLRKNSTKKVYWRQNTLVTNTRNIRLGVITSGGFDLPNTWENSLNAALREFNELDGELFFNKRRYRRYYHNINNIVWIIPISFVEIGFDEGDPINTVGWAQPLSGTSIAGDPSKYILLNTDNPLFNLWSFDQRKQILLHEIGHSIGFLHTDSNEGTQVFGLSRDCRSGTHPHSIMRATVNSSANNDFTDCDIEMYRRLY